MSRLLGGGGPASGPVSGATYFAGGAGLPLSASTSGHASLAALVQNVDGAQSVSFDATAFSGAGGARLLLPGVYEVQMLLALTGAGAGQVVVSLDATPFNGFSDISSGTYPTPLSAAAPIVLPFLFFTGTSLPLDTLGVACGNQSDAAASFSVLSFRVRRVGGV